MSLRYELVLKNGGHLGGREGLMKDAVPSIVPNENKNKNRTIWGEMTRMIYVYRKADSRMNLHVIEIWKTLKISLPLHCEPKEEQFASTGKTTTVPASGLI